MSSTILIRFLSMVALVVLAVQPGRGQTTSVADRSETELSIDWSSIDRSSNDLEASVFADGEIEIITRGEDPFFYFRLPPLSPSDRDWVLAWEFFSPQGVRDLQWRSGDGVRRPPFDEMPPMPKSEGWTTYSVNVSKLDQQIADAAGAGASGMEVRIDLGRQAGRRLRVRNVVVRPMSDRELATARAAIAIEQKKREQAKQYREYHEQTWDVSIESVAWDGETLKLSGKFEPKDESGSFLMIARPPQSLVALTTHPGECEGRWNPVIDQSQQTWTLAMYHVTLLRRPIASSWFASRIGQHLAVGSRQRDQARQLADDSAERSHVVGQRTKAASSRPKCSCHHPSWRGDRRHPTDTNTTRRSKGGRRPKGVRRSAAP